MRSHACHHAAVVHHAMHVNHAAAVHMAMHHFGGFGGTTTHVYHHSHHTNTSSRPKHSYYESEPTVKQPTFDEVKLHIKKHLTVSHYQSASDFETLVHLFLSSNEMTIKEKIQYLHDCITGLDGPYFWDKYSDVVAQMPRYTANIVELFDLVIPFHFALQTPTYENAARDMANHDRNFVAAIEKHYLIHDIKLSDLSKLLTAHDDKKSMADILDYSAAFFSLLDNALSRQEFTSDAIVINIIKNMESHRRQVFGQLPVSHSIMEKLLKKGADANELFSLLKDSYAFDHNILKYAHLLVVFSEYGIDKAVIKAKLQTELTIMLNRGEATPRYKTLGNNFGPVFCLLAKNGLLPHLEYDHDMRKAIFKEIKKLPAAEQQSILNSILKHEDNDISHLYWRAPHAQFLFGHELMLPDYWKKKIESALTKLEEAKHSVEEKAERQSKM